METKIALPRLAQYLSEKTGKSKKLCEEFLKELFRIIADELGKGESTRIKGFGTFKIVEVEARKSVDVSTGEENEIPAHKKVMFVASKELAAKVNLPFEMFEAMEVADEVPTDLLTSEEIDFPMETVDREYEMPEEQIEEQVSSDEPEEQQEEQLSPELPENEPAGKMEAEERKKEVLEKEAVNIAEETDDTVAAYKEEDSEYNYEEEPEEPERKKRRFGWGFVAGFVSAIILAFAGLVVWFGVDIFKNPAALFSGLANNDSEVNPVEQVSAEEKDTTDDSLAGISDNSTVSGDSIISQDESEVPTQPSDQPVYDTVSTTRYLTTMAKEHYGNFNLWPIIYEENKDILGHPNYIRPGTKVVIPSLKKYGVDPSNPEDIARMKQKGNEIYARFKKTDN